MLLAVAVATAPSLAAQLVHRGTTGEKTPPSGFRTIHLYLGEERARGLLHGTGETMRDKHDVRIDRTGTYHAQVGQDRTIARLFSSSSHSSSREDRSAASSGGSFFVDLASNEPLYLSNTRYLERDLGWRGVCIEGSTDLVLKTAAYRTCTVVQAVVSRKSGEKISFMVPPRSATTSTRNAQDLKTSGYGGVEGLSDAEPTTKTRRTAGGWRTEKHISVALTDLLDSINAPSTISYLSLDVEGAEDSVLRTFDFGRYRFLTMTIERPPLPLRETLRANGYVYVGDHGCFGDQLWVHSSFASHTEHALDLPPRTLERVRDRGLESWFTNCTVFGTRAANGFHFD
jgi:hypothetical protein